MTTLYTDTGRRVVLDTQLAAGGEGAVHTVRGEPGLVAKIYHQGRTPVDLDAKIRRMVSQPPSDPTRNGNPPHTSIVWPRELLFDSSSGGRQFRGFTMDRIVDSVELLVAFNPTLRQSKAPHHTIQSLYRIGFNVAAAVQSIHRAGYVIGDVNQKNILVRNNGLVTLIDTDSMQVRGLNGALFTCKVGVEDYTPRESIGHGGKTELRPTHDYFGLAVLIFQLVMNGVHPFTGRAKTPAMQNVQLIHHYCIANGIFPHQQNAYVEPPPAAQALSSLAPELQQLFVRAFVDGHHDPGRRPTANEWAQALNTAQAALVRCGRNGDHWYDRRQTRCPLCVLTPVPLPPPVPPPPPPPTFQRTAAAAPGAPAPAVPAWTQPAVSTSSTSPQRIALGCAFLLLAYLFIAFLVPQFGRSAGPSAGSNVPAASSMSNSVPAASLDTTGNPTVPASSTNQRSIPYGSQLYLDNFSAQDGGWEPYFSSSAGSNGYREGSYYFHIKRNTFLYDLTLQQTFEDMVIDADFTLNTGSGLVGVMFGFVGDPVDHAGATYYRAMIDRYGLPVLKYHRSGAVDDIVVRLTGASAGFTPGTNTRLTLVVAGRDLRFFRASREIGEATLPRTHRGYVGMVAAAQSGQLPFEVEFSRIRVSTVSE